MYRSKSDSKVSSFYTVLIMLLFLIPNYFAIKASIEKQHYENSAELLNWLYKVEKSIYIDELELPISVKFTVGLYTQNHHKIISNLEKEPNLFSFRTLVNYPYMYYQKNIDKNQHNVAYIVCAMEINYSMILLMASILFLVVLVIIYLFNMVMIRNSTIPYKIMQRYMNDFFNDAMHELKTPLGVININLELISRTTPPTKHIKRIKAATKQMQMTYEDVEYYIKNHKVKYIREKIDLSQYLKSRIEFFEDIALSKQIELNSIIEDNLIVFINVTEIQRVIDNTISNAIKYSSFQGKIEISLEKDSDDFCNLIVKDYGQGIKDIKTIFYRFKREDAAQGGFGLGLNIVQNICNKNDIEIGIESIEDIGSTFSYKISLYRVKFLDKAEYEGK